MVNHSLVKDQSTNLSLKTVVLKLWYAKTFKVVCEEAYFLFFFTKNIFTGVVFTCRVLLINS